VDTGDMSQTRSKSQHSGKGFAAKDNPPVTEGNVKIGLEIHCQLTKLKTKLFCGCFSNYRDINPNENTCPICLGLPGSLPMLNKKAVEYASMMCLALNCDIPPKITFYRKNYFYPDLPKNFQITQYNSYELSSIGHDGFLPYCDYKGEGQATENHTGKTTRIKRIQLEEDPGKIIYEDDGSRQNNYCLIDYNRAGVALVEIVTEPDFSNAADVRSFLNKITNIFEYLGVSDPDLDGAIRCDVNVSVKGGKKVEIKNISSFKDVERSIFYEVTRQKTLSLHEINVKSETRHWDEKRRITIPARTKEEEDEYKYFPEPDIPRIVLGIGFKEKIKEKMPELPIERLKRYRETYKLSSHTSNILINNKKICDFFEESLEIYHSPKEVSNWIINELLSKTNEGGGGGGGDGGVVENVVVGEKDKDGFNDTGNDKNRPFDATVTPQQIADIAKLVEEKSINRNTAKDIFYKSIKTGESPLKLIENRKIEKILDSGVINMHIDNVLNDEKHLIEQSNTNPNVNNFILGKIMKITHGRADPQLTLRLIRESLSEKNKKKEI
jgi:aspartyl-tRNA(Asn)/glutamyl-tRNA(Gln) amidotransferase subunit B